MANKEATVAELTELFQSSTAVLLTEYRGLTVAQLKRLRTSMSEHAIGADLGQCLDCTTISRIPGNQSILGLRKLSSFV